MDQRTSLTLNRRQGRQQQDVIISARLDLIFVVLLCILRKAAAQGAQGCSPALSYNNTDLYGGDLRGYNFTQDPAVCCALCTGYPDCTGWTAVAESAGLPVTGCFLKSASLAQLQDIIRPTVGCTSGFKVNVNAPASALGPAPSSGAQGCSPALSYNNTDLYGGDLLGYNFNTQDYQDPAVCCALCTGYPACTGWTSVAETADVPGVGCFLKSASLAQLQDIIRPTVGCTSGFKSSPIGLYPPGQAPELDPASPLPSTHPPQASSSPPTTSGTAPGDTSN